MGEAESFIERYAGEIHAAETEYAKATWDLETTSSDEAKDRLVQTEVRLNAVFQRPDDWATVKGYYQDRESIRDQALRRQIERLYLAFAGNQDNPERVEAIARLSADVSADFTAFRASVDGREVSDNDLDLILRTETETAALREAWEAGKEIGPVVADRVVELAELRNEGACEMGYRDFYAQSLDLQEIDEDVLFSLLDDLDRQTREPFARIKAELDSRPTRWFGIDQDQLMPWHYANAFFQEPPPLTEVTLDPLFRDRDVVKLSAEAFQRLGLEVADILKRSGLYERPKKNQHAFEIHIDALSDDVRLLCNVRQDEFWTTTMMHELGHAVYDKYLSSDLPFLLRSAAHISSTEAIAMLMGRLTRNPDWLLSVTESLSEPRGWADRLHATLPLGCSHSFAGCW